MTRLFQHSAIVLAVLFAVASSAACADEEVPFGVETRVGEAVTVVLHGNPSTGYGWHLNETSSQGLELVALEDKGTVPVAPAEDDAPGSVGAPVLVRIAITGKSPGQAFLAYDYARSWESVPPARTVRILVVVSP